MVQMYSDIKRTWGGVQGVAIARIRDYNREMALLYQEVLCDKFE